MKTQILRPSEEIMFPPEIVNISAMFVTIFNQSIKAEHNDLDQIAGPGFRKAIEFLIKDFIISKFKPDETERIDKIKKMFLAQCIEEFIDNSQIKQCSKRAVWLGNDETHYIRKWDSKDIQDLKTLISMTVNWIELDVKTNEFLSSMPDTR